MKRDFSVFPRVTRVWALLLSLLVSLDITAGGAEVVVVFNANLSESRRVAEYYASRRDVPAGHLIGLKIPDSETNRISRADFVTRMVEPLIRELGDRGLTHFNRKKLVAPSPMAGRWSYSVDSSKVRYLLLCYGLPYYVMPDFSINGFKDEGLPTNTPPGMLRNQASTDSELTLLPSFGRFPLSGAVPNPFYGETNRELLNPTNGVFLVSRLDGPSSAVARGLVDKARLAERDGLNGRAYFDLRGVTSGDYQTGDEWIGHAAEVAKAIGYDTEVDNQSANLTVGFPLSQVALYSGWYAMQVDGPFTRPSVEFMPGAIAYHLFSFSAFEPRSAAKSWVGTLLDKGAAVTLGCVDEPFLGITPNIGLFLERMAFQKFTVGEAALVCQPGLSWQTIVFGDPLYRPFLQHPLEQEQWFALHPSPLLAWTLIRKVNLYLNQGRDPLILERYLTEQPLATNSSVLAEKISSMAAARKDFRTAVAWGKKALSMDPTPQQKSRLLRVLAKLERVDDPLEAVETLEEFARAFPDHPDLIAVRREQLEMLAGQGKDEVLARLTTELQRLESLIAPPPTTQAK